MKVYVILCLVDGCEAHEEPCGKNAHVQAVCTAGRMPSGSWSCTGRQTRTGGLPRCGSKLQ